ncbi:MAG TPA: FAD-dependent oxidoreductase, partial [Arenimonas sp.]|nr:FAD-dependent oxidoreductase [Arenimonas sp.]
MARIELRVPDIGDDKDVPVIEMLVAVGDTVARDQGLVTLESDKATMEVPASAAGTIVELRVKLGDTVSAGDVVAIAEATLTTSVGGPSGPTAPQAAAPSPKSIGPEGPPTAASAAPAAAANTGRKADIECRMLVLGAGPGGYTAAFRSADLGLDTVLVERYESLGGVCLNVGCIPSKALLHAAEVLVEARHAEDFGVSFGAPKIDLDKLRGHKDKVVGQMVKGLSGMAKQRKVRTVTGTATFVSPHEVEVREVEGTKLIRFEQCIIAAGSQPVKLAGFPWDDARVMDSTDALMLADIPKQLLVVGGGIIGLEMACVYSALGSTVTVVEFMDQLMPGADKDLVKPLADLLKKRGVAVHLGCKVARVDAKKDGLHATFEGALVPANTKYDRVLVSVGRTPNGGKLGADRAGVAVTERGFIPVDRQMRTNVPHIFAIGDLVGQPMLAHKAT